MQNSVEIKGYEAEISVAPRLKRSRPGNDVSLLEIGHVLIADTRI